MQEYELDHVFVGRSDRMPVPDPEEVSDFRYLPMPQIREEMLLYPGRYAVWFRIMVCGFEKGVTG